jgi:N-acetyl-anhydromuramyl-L-alanine amidase AmpD
MQRRNSPDESRMQKILRSVLPLLAGAIAGCAATPVIDYPSANQDGRVRFLVLHFTDEDFERSLDLLTRPHAHPVSAHYLVSRAGEYGRAAPSVLRLVDESQRAWHAGASRWQGHSSLNGESIGVEIVYESQCPRAPRADTVSPYEAAAQCPYPDYPDDQIAAVIALAQGIIRRHPDIEPSAVVGHGDIQPENKTDPGPRFPWRRLAAAGVGAWYDAADVARYRTGFGDRAPDLRTAQEALAAYGYGLDASGEYDLRTREVVAAFQTHFRPDHVTGTADGETVATLFALLHRYRAEALAALRARHPELPGDPPPARP